MGLPAKTKDQYEETIRKLRLENIALNKEVGELCTKLIRMEEQVRRSAGRSDHAAD